MYIYVCVCREREREMGEPSSNMKVFGGHCPTSIRKET